MELSVPHLLVLADIRARRWKDIREVGERYRQKVVDLGMMEPPLVDIQGDYLEITVAGRAELNRRTVIAD